MLFGLIVIGIAARCSIGEDAAAATQREPPQMGAKADPLLGPLSFSSSHEPIAVTADTLEFDYRAHVLTYKGSVVATQGDMKLQSHTLTVALADQGGTQIKGESQLKEVVAAGDVRLSKGTRWATAGRAVFDQIHRTAVLSEDAVLHDGPNQVSGERVVVYLDEERSVVEGGNSRVKAVLFPPKDEPARVAGATEPAPTREAP